MARRTPSGAGCGGGVEFLPLVGGEIEFELAARLLAGLGGFELRRRHRRRDIVQRRGEELGDLGEGFEILAGAPYGAASADEFHADGLADLLGAAEQDGADLASGAHVGAAAGAAVEAGDGDDAQRALAVGRLAESLRLAASSKATSRARFSETSCWRALGFRDDAGVDRGAFEIDGGGSAPRWKLTVWSPKSSSKTAESRCWPECCCMWSKRRVQSIAQATGPAPRAARRGGGRCGRPRPPRR